VPHLRGQGLPGLKTERMIELLGAHGSPQRLRGSVDPDRYKGLPSAGADDGHVKHALDDIRLFYGNDVRFLQHLPDQTEERISRNDSRFALRDTRDRPPVDEIAACLPSRHESACDQGGRRLVGVGCGPSTSLSRIQRR